MAAPSKLVFSSHLAVSCERKVGETSALLTGKAEVTPKATSQVSHPRRRMKKLMLQKKMHLPAGRGTRVQSSGTTFPSEHTHPTPLRGQKTLELQLTNLSTEMFAGNNCHQNTVVQIIQDILFPHKQIHQTTQTFLLLDFSQQQSEP